MSWEPSEGTVRGMRWVTGGPCLTLDKASLFICWMDSALDKAISEMHWRQSLICWMDSRNGWLLAGSVSTLHTIGSKHRMEDTLRLKK